MNSELLFKSNAMKHVIEISGSEFDKNDDSTILIYCNVYNGTPMAVVIHYPRPGVPAPVISNGDYTVTINSGVSEDGNEYSEFVLVLRAMQKALED